MYKNLVSSLLHTTRVSSRYQTKGLAALGDRVLATFGTHSRRQTNLVGGDALRGIEFEALAQQVQRVSRRRRKHIRQEPAAAYARPSADRRKEGGVGRKRKKETILKGPWFVDGEGLEHVGGKG